ncbi:MAG: DUF1841 family protein [Burkholderiaceae bacterium]|jgi:hypothetical protein
MFNPTREEVRRFFIDAWSKSRAGTILSPIEAIAVDWIAEHPEYHSLLESASTALEEEYTPERERTNPFLHLSMHLSITEQISIDQPTGIRDAAHTLAQQLHSVHEAQHAVMDCLGEMLWTAQRNNVPPDGAAYVDCVKRKAGSGAH